MGQISPVPTLRRRCWNQWEVKAFVWRRTGASRSAVPRSCLGFFVWKPSSNISILSSLFPFFIPWVHVLLLKTNCRKISNIWYGIKGRIALLMEKKQWEKRIFFLDWKYKKSLALVRYTVIQHVFCCEMTSVGWGVRMEFQLIPWNYADYLRCQMYMCQGAFESSFLVRSFFKSECLGPFSSVKTGYKPSPFEDDYQF